MKTPISKPRFRIGSRVKLTQDAADNYPGHSGKVLTISAVSTAYMPAAEFYAKRQPSGYHPGFDEAAGCALYDAEGLTFSVYEWEIETAD